MPGILPVIRHAPAEFAARSTAGTAGAGSTADAGAANAAGAGSTADAGVANAAGAGSTADAGGANAADTGAGVAVIHKTTRPEQRHMMGCGDEVRHA